MDMTLKCQIGGATFPTRNMHDQKKQNKNRLEALQGFDCVLSIFRVLDDTGWQHVWFTLLESTITPPVFLSWSSSSPPPPPPPASASASPSPPSFFFPSLLFPQPSLVQLVLLVSLQANEEHEGQKPRAHAGAYGSGGSRLEGGGSVGASARIWLQLGWLASTL